MPQGTLANLATSAFVRTPPALAERIVRCLLAFPPDQVTNILDPTAGEGDLLLPCQDIPLARLYGVEISAERTDVARARLPQAELVTCAFEGVSIPKGSMSLVLANPPYFFQDGKRAEYRILADAGTLLVPGGVLVAILPARSAWDGTMINHWCRWYERVRVWKFPDRSSSSRRGECLRGLHADLRGRHCAAPNRATPSRQRCSVCRAIATIAPRWRHPARVPPLAPARAGSRERHHRNCPCSPSLTPIPCRRAWRVRTSWCGTPTSPRCWRHSNAAARTSLPSGRRPPSGVKRDCANSRSCRSPARRMWLPRC